MFISGLKNKKSWELAFVLLLFLGALGFTLYKNLTLSREFHLSLQANSFLAGRTDIFEMPEMVVDTIMGNGGRFYFWHEPLASVLMVPLVIVFGRHAPQGILQFMITIINIFLVNKLLSKNEKTKKLLVRLWFLLIFFFASNTVSLIFSPNSWYLVQNLGLTFVICGLIEWQGKRRMGVIFINMLLLVLTRRIMGLMLGGYYLSYFLVFPEKRKNIIPVVAALLAGILGSLVISWYFGLGFPGGGFQELSKNPALNQQTDIAQTEKIVKAGLFNINNVPSNLVKFFLLGPEIVKALPDAHSNLIYPYMYPKQDGMSFFILSPIFLALFLLPLGKIRNYLPVLGALFVWAAIYLTSMSSGAAQFGARYTAEMVPFLFLILIEILPSFLSKRVKILVTVSTLLNILFFILLNAYGALMR